MLRVENLSKSFGSFPVFKDVKFSMGLGDALQITGPNGSGKTTLLKCLSGYLESDFDALTYNEGSIKNTDVAFVSSDDRCFFPKLTLSENLGFFQKFYGTQFNLELWKSRLGLEAHWGKAYQDCSTGIRKRLALLRGICKQTPILFLDEPFANIDPEFQPELQSYLFNSDFLNNKILIFASNNPINHQKLKNFSLKKGSRS